MGVVQLPAMMTGTKCPSLPYKNVNDIMNLTCIAIVVDSAVS
ncbi:hypothetical protein [Bacillus sp. FJAT-49736]|nr:hypothetical protein [Bacillus sp. FJAT-49736]